MAKELIKAKLHEHSVHTESSDAAQELAKSSCFGVILENGKVSLSLIEGFYLLESKRLDIRNNAGRKVSIDTYVKKARKYEPAFLVKFTVYADLRKRGYVVKTALKFGADFRVYDKGVKPGEDHAKWVVFAVSEGEGHTWHSFSAKNRVAHSTKKRLLLGVVDNENSVTYYEVRWVRP